MSFQKNLYYKLKFYIYGDFGKSYLVLKRAKEIPNLETILQTQISYKGKFWSALMCLFVIFGPSELLIFLVRNYSHCIRDCYNSTLLHLLCLRTYYNNGQKNPEVIDYLKTFLPQQQYYDDRDSFGRTPQFYIRDESILNLLPGDPDWIDNAGFNSAQYYLMTTNFSGFRFKDGPIFKLHLKQYPEKLLKTAIYVKQCRHSVQYVLANAELSDDLKAEGEAALSYMDYNCLMHFPESRLCQCSNIHESERFHALRHLNHYMIAQNCDDKMRMTFLLDNLNSLTPHPTIPTFLFKDVLDILIRNPSLTHKKFGGANKTKLFRFHGIDRDHVHFAIMHTIHYLMQFLSSEERIYYTKELCRVYERSNLPSKLQFMFEWFTNLKERETMIDLVTFAVKNFRGQENWLSTFLHIACYKGDVQNVHFFLKHGADPNEQNLMQQTPMHVAHFQKPEIYQLLVEFGGHQDIVDKDGEKANTKFVKDETVYSLQCLSARVIAVIPKNIPKSISHFIRSHQQYSYLTI